MSDKWMCYNEFVCVLSLQGRALGLAVNPEEDQLYISLISENMIVVTSLDGSTRRTIINCTGAPQCLTVDLNKR